VLRAASVDGSLTGYETLLISVGLYDIPHGEHKTRICEQLDFVGFIAEAGRIVGQYSDGMVCHNQGKSPKSLMQNG